MKGFIDYLDATWFRMSWAAGGVITWTVFMVLAIVAPQLGVTAWLFGGLLGWLFLSAVLLSTENSRKKQRR